MLLEDEQAGLWSVPNLNNLSESKIEGNENEGRSLSPKKDYITLKYCNEK